MLGRLSEVLQTAADVVSAEKSADFCLLLLGMRHPPKEIATASRWKRCVCRTMQVVTRYVVAGGYVMETGCMLHFFPSARNCLIVYMRSMSESSRTSS